MSEKYLKDFSFSRALDAILEGDRVSREEWGDTRHYGLMKDGILVIHKAGEKADLLHPWILNEADITSDDWIIIKTEIKK